MSGEGVDFREILAEHVLDGNTYVLPKQVILRLPSVCGLQLTKFMVVELVVAFLMILLFVVLKKKMCSDKPLSRRSDKSLQERWNEILSILSEVWKGKFWNLSLFPKTFLLLLDVFFLLLEVGLLYLRNEVFIPSIGKKDADKFAPFLWTLFFFILFCNLAGLVPWFGASPTGSLATTSVLATATLLVLIGSGMKERGVVGFWLGQIPSVELPFALAIVLKPMLFVIEILELFIKHAVLAIRLLANMFAGHLVLSVIFLLDLFATIFAYVHFKIGDLALSLTVGVCLGCALNLLELLVAFLQAYIFTFLAAIFIGMARHEH